MKTVLLKKNRKKKNNLLKKIQKFFDFVVWNHFQKLAADIFDIFGRKFQIFNFGKKSRAESRPKFLNHIHLWSTISAFNWVIKILPLRFCTRNLVPSDESTTMDGSTSPKLKMGRCI